MRIVTALSLGCCGWQVNVIEQNSSPNGVNTYNKADAGCFLTGGGSPAGACSHLGYYCGNDGLSLGSSTLYYCSGAGASPAVSKACGNTHAPAIASTRRLIRDALVCVHVHVPVNVCPRPAPFALQCHESMLVRVSAIGVPVRVYLRDHALGLR